jgi:hypothetical protein
MCFGLAAHADLTEGRGSLGARCRIASWISHSVSTWVVAVGMEGGADAGLLSGCAQAPSARKTNTTAIMDTRRHFEFMALALIPFVVEALVV